MKAFVITLKDNEYSLSVANKCIKSAEKHKLTVDTFFGVDKLNSLKVMQDFNLKWTWANNNTKIAYCPITGLRQHPYRTNDLRSIIGCAMSHFLLWKKCVELNEPILILEHDVVFINNLPKFNFKGICQINDPNKATRKGGIWSKFMSDRGTVGVHPKTLIINDNEKDIPDGLAGNSAYCIKPFAAQELINKYYELGVWPNDAIMCIQLFPYLEEYYPFITRVEQTKSTTTS